MHETWLASASASVSQATHTDMPEMGATVAPGQVLHLGLPDEEIWPGMQSRHSERPASSWKRPAEHSRLHETITRDAKPLTKHQLSDLPLGRAQLVGVRAGGAVEQTSRGEITQGLRGVCSPDRALDGVGFAGGRANGAQVAARLAQQALERADAAREAGRVGEALHELAGVALLADGRSSVRGEGARRAGQAPDRSTSRDEGTGRTTSEAQDADRTLRCGPPRCSIQPGTSGRTVRRSRSRPCPCRSPGTPRRLPRA